MFNLFVKLYYYEIECIYDYSNSINNWATKENKKGLSPNIPINSNDPIGITPEEKINNKLLYFL